MLSENPLPHRGSKLASELRLAFRSVAPPTEPPRPIRMQCAVSSWPSLIGHPASVDVKQHKKKQLVIVQELCESRGGRPGLSVLTNLQVSVDVKNY